jgi:hypothetical protein
MPRGLRDTAIMTRPVGVMEMTPGPLRGMGDASNAASGPGGHSNGTAGRDGAVRRNGGGPPPPFMSFARRGIKKPLATVPAPSPPVNHPSRSATTPVASSKSVPSLQAGRRRSESLGTQQLKALLPPSTTRPPVEIIAREQAFDGSFAGSVTLLQLIAKQDHSPQLPNSLVSLSLSEADKQIIWCTILCLVYLTTQCSEQQAVWALMGEKALSSVGELLSGGISSDQKHVEALIEEWKEAAIQYVR